MKNARRLGLHCFTLLRVARPNSVTLDKAGVPDTVNDLVQLGLQSSLLFDIPCPPIVGIDKAAVLETEDDLLRFVLHRQLRDGPVPPHFKSVDKVPVHKTVDNLPRFRPHDNLLLSVVAPRFKRQDQNSMTSVIQTPSYPQGCRLQAQTFFHTANPPVKNGDQTFVPPLPYSPYCFYAQSLNI